MWLIPATTSRRLDKSAFIGAGIGGAVPGSGNQLSWATRRWIGLWPEPHFPMALDAILSFATTMLLGANWYPLTARWEGDRLTSRSPSTSIWFQSGFVGTLTNSLWVPDVRCSPGDRRRLCTSAVLLWLGTVDEYRE